jgi:catechol 2,3-dioxygenase-like lactoylglutathione lyase family enzyme
MPAFRFLFTAQDYERAVAFYAKTLALPVVESWDGDSRGTIVAAAGGQIEILDGASPGAPRVGGAAIAWEVADLDAEIDRLRIAGVKIFDPPTDRPWGLRTASIEDPDGLRVTLFTFLDPQT